MKIPKYLPQPIVSISQHNTLNRSYRQEHSDIHVNPECPFYTVNTGFAYGSLTFKYVIKCNQVVFNPEYIELLEPVVYSCVVDFVTTTYLDARTWELINNLMYKINVSVASFYKGYPYLTTEYLDEEFRRIVYVLQIESGIVKELVYLVYEDYYSLKYYNKQSIKTT